MIQTTCNTRKDNRYYPSPAPPHTYSPLHQRKQFRFMFNMSSMSVSSILHFFPKFKTTINDMGNLMSNIYYSITHR